MPGQVTSNAGDLPHKKKFFVERKAQGSITLPCLWT